MTLKKVVLGTSHKGNLLITTEGCFYITTPSLLMDVPAFYELVHIRERIYGIHRVLPLGRHQR